MITIELQMQILELRTQGQSVRQIAQTLHLAPNTVQAWLVKLQPQIDRAVQDQVEQVLETHHAQRLVRVQALAREFNRINITLETQADSLSFNARTKLTNQLSRFASQLDRMELHPRFDPKHELDQFVLSADPLPDDAPVEMTMEPKVAQKTEPPISPLSSSATSVVDSSPPPDEKTDTKLVQNPEPVTVTLQNEEERLRKEQLSRIAGQIQTLIFQKQQT